LVFTEISVIRNSRVETESVFTEIEILEKKKNAHKLSRISDMNPPLPPQKKKKKEVHANQRGVNGTSSTWRRASTLA
jgi:hypothetical protein